VGWGSYPDIWENRYGLKNGEWGKRVPRELYYRKGKR